MLLLNKTFRSLIKMKGGSNLESVINFMLFPKGPNINLFDPLPRICSFISEVLSVRESVKMIERKDGNVYVAEL